MRVRRSLGITMMPEFAQCEGVNAVVDAIGGRLGADVLVTTPSVVEPVAAGLGVREPPDDGGAGNDRTLDRALWGKTSLHIRSAPSFAPDPARYAGLAYRPPVADALTAREGPVVGRLLDAAKAAGLKVQLQLMAAAPPAIRVQERAPRDRDEPLTPFGAAVPGRVDANRSLASEDLRAYMRALIGDVLANYPACDALRFDWPEYPPYAPASLMFDFSPAAVQRGAALGHDVEGLRRRVTGELSAWRGAGRLPPARGLDALLAGMPVLAELLAYRAALVADYVTALTGMVREMSGGRVEAIMQAFPPPLNRLSGFDFGALDGVPAEIAVKQYTMHWPMIERAHVAGVAAGAGVPEAAALDFVRPLLGLDDAPPGPVEHIVYPDPDRPHPAGSALLGAMAAAACGAITRSRASVIVHGYGPTDDVLRRFDAVAATSPRLHINRYGYLSDAKITALGARWQALAGTDHNQKQGGLPA